MEEKSRLIFLKLVFPKPLGPSVDAFIGMPPLAPGEQFSAVILEIAVLI